MAKRTTRSPRKSTTATGVGVRKRIGAIIGRLPKARAVDAGDHLGLEVGNKRFGWLLVDHHGDGRIALNCRSSPGWHEMLRNDAPEHFHIPKYMGRHGWVGLWLDVPNVDWSLVEETLREAYRLTAPKKLLAAVEAEG